MDEDREAFVLMVFGLFLMSVLPLPLLFLIVVTFSMYRFKTFPWTKIVNKISKEIKRVTWPRWLVILKKIIPRRGSQNGTYDQQESEHWRKTSPKHTKTKLQDYQEVVYHHQGCIHQQLAQWVRVPFNNRMVLRHEVSLCRSRRRGLCSRPGQDQRSRLLHDQRTL